MPQLFRQRRGKLGAAPGTVEFLGPPRIDRTRLQAMAYSPDQFTERELASIDPFLDGTIAGGCRWLNVDGLHDTANLQRLGDRFGLHPLVQEDIVSPHQRPKLEDYEDYLYTVCQMITFDEPTGRCLSEQVSLVVGPDWVLTFQEVPGDVFDGVRHRLRQGKGRLRGGGSAYLAYALLDAVVDSYFVVIEQMGLRIEQIEERLLAKPDAEQLAAVHALKREMIHLRRAVWPLREVVGALERGESKLVPKSVRLFYRDLYDHIIQAAEAVETYRDILTGLQDLYLSSVSNRMNEVIKVLTIIGTLFIPLTFLVGVYGMNFKYMPELGWKWSYPLFWLICLGAVGGMLAWLKRRGWL
jgi:magnesium transporter